jgi:hypothetical protein
MNFGVYPELTKDYILQRISQEQIMEKYLNIPVQTKQQILSPFRNEGTPSCGFYYNNQGRLRIRDLGGTFWGDCFDVVAWDLNVNSSNKRAFQLILHTIAKDFRIHKYEDSKEVKKYTNLTKEFFTKKKPKKRTMFRITPRSWNYHDEGYWRKFNINKNILYAGKVFPAQSIDLVYTDNDITIYNYATKDPAYCYWGGKDANGIDLWKIYYPLRKKGGELPRFHSNSSFLQGKHLITGGRIGIITKAYKDVLAFRSFGLEAVAPSAESILISKEDYHFMNSHFDYLISCMDYDNTGIRMMQKMWKTYRIQPFMFTDGRNNTVNYGVKDFAEHVDIKGIQSTRVLIGSIFDKYKFDLYDLDTYFYNKLKFIS